VLSCSNSCHESEQRPFSLPAGEESRFADFDKKALAEMHMVNLYHRLSYKKRTEWQNPLHDGFMPRQKWFVEKILSPCSGLTLDLGCGRGLWSRKLRERGILAIGVDSSMARLKKCRAECNNDNLFCASAANLPFASDSLDTVLFLEVIEHLDEEQQDRSLREIHRVLKPKGLVVVTTPNRPMYRLITKLLHLFEYNPEHVRELSLAEAKGMMERYFALVLVDGKLGFLDRLMPTGMCWDILVIAKKP